MLLHFYDKYKVALLQLPLLLCLNPIVCLELNAIDDNGVIEIVAEEIESNDIDSVDLDIVYNNDSASFPSFVDRGPPPHEEAARMARYGVDQGPPPHEEAARMARYVAHNSEWVAMATISTRSPIQGFPFSNVFSMSDGPVDNSTGIPYMYLTAWEMSVKDLMVDNRASLTMSLAQGQYCNQNDLDPEDPRCAHIILTGRVVRVHNNTKEAEFAKEALFSRHPIMPDWPKGHEWFFGKLDIENILVLDFFGGAITVPVDEYFAATPY